MRRRARGQGTDGVPGARPWLPEPLVERPELLCDIVDALRARDRPVAVTGPGGAGKTVLAARACQDRLLRRSYRDGMAWLEAAEAQDPVELLAALAHRLGMKSEASSFATVEQGRELLRSALAGKRLLIVVDNVSERMLIDAFRGLSPTCPVMFTSRVPELAAAVKATQIRVDGLTLDQSLELLRLRTGHASAALPPQAETLCAKSGGLALAVALVSGIAASRSFPEALEWLEQFLDGPDSGASPGSGLPRHLVEAAIAAMPNAWQSRYEELAVFAGRGAFPFDAVQALWQRYPDGGPPAPLLDAFVSRGLLTARGAGLYAAHDLQYDVLEGRLGGDRLAAAHSQLLDGYRVRYTDGWAESSDDPYLARNLAGHMREARLSGELRAILTDPRWIQARLTLGPAHELIHDYRHTVDPLTRQVMRILRLEAASLATDPGLVWSHLTNRLLSHPDPGITAWAVGSNATTPVHPPKQTLTGHTGPVRTVAVSQDGTRAVSGSDDGTVRVWDLTTGTERAILTGHTDWVRAVAISQDGTRAVSGSDDGTVRVWDLTTGTERAILTGHDGEVFAVAITPAGDRAVSGGSDRILRVWDLDNGSERTVLAGHSRPVWSVVFADATRAVSASGDGTVRVWDLTTGTERAILTGHDGEVFAVAITPDGDRAVSSGGDGTLREWSVPAGQRHAVLVGHTGWVRAVMLADNKPLAVSGGEDASVRVWDLTTGTERATLTGHHGEVFAVAITPDGDRAVSGGGDETLRVWDLS